MKPEAEAKAIEEGLKRAALPAEPITLPDAELEGTPESGDDYLKLYYAREGIGQLPDWIDRAEWAKVDANNRWAQVQLLLLMKGHTGHGAAMSALRGGVEGTEPPPWLKKGTRLAAIPMDTMTALERTCAQEVGRGIEAMQRRAEVNLFCDHEWAIMPEVNKSRVCKKCGYVQVFDRG